MKKLAHGRAHGRAPNLQLETGDKRSETLEEAAVVEDNDSVKCLISALAPLPSIRLIFRPPARPR